MGGLSGRDLALGGVAALAAASVAMRAGSRAGSRSQADPQLVNDEDWVPAPPSEQSFRKRALAELPDCLGRHGSLYHVTTFRRMAGVAKRGLVVGAGLHEDSTFRHFSGRSRGKLFLAAGLDAGIAWWTLIRQQYDPEPVLLKIDPAIRRGRSVFHDNKGWNDVPCSFYTKKGIAQRFLQYWDPEEDAFMPLSAWAEVLKYPENRAGRFCPYSEAELAEGDEDYEDDAIHFAPAGS